LKMKFFVLLLLIATSVSSANDSGGVPTELFGIELGSVVDLGDSETGDQGNVPVKKFRGVNRFMGHGVHYYFQPEQEYKAFEYIEKPKQPTDEYFETSFRLYLLPLIPASITTKKQLENARTNWEVAHIEWLVKADTEKDAYWWANNLCKTFEIDLSLEPERTDYFTGAFSPLFRCVFQSANGELTVSGEYGYKSVSLSYPDETIEEKDEAVDRILRKLDAQDIRPYK